MLYTTQSVNCILYVDFDTQSPQLLQRGPDERRTETNKTHQEWCLVRLSKPFAVLRLNNAMS